MTAIGTILLILIGLPLVAWWLGGRSFWSRARTGAERDLYREIVRRHGLRPAETPKVESAVTWGRRLDDPRLRAAAVDWATSSQDEMAEYRRRNPLARRLMVGLLFLWLLLVLGRALAAVVEGRWGSAAWQLLWLATLVAPMALFSWRMRRAVELNRD
ncbi:hypothetical protein [Blastococcus sp. SYSU DS0617]